MKLRLDRSFARPSALRPRRNSDIICRLGLNDALKLLEINDDCTLVEVKKAYRQKIKQLHPDLGTDQSCEKKTVDLNLAYEVACKGKGNKMNLISDLADLVEDLA
jgi:DnaJ-domain-containing protein 1